MGVGRKRLPDELHKLRGTYKPSRHGPRDKEPLLEAGAPSAPDWLCRTAKAEWRRVVKILGITGVLTEGDRALLSGYCSLWAQLKRQTEAQEDVGKTVAQLRLCCSELGLTPAARAKMSAPNAKKENPFAKFLEPDGPSDGVRPSSH